MNPNRPFPIPVVVGLGPGSQPEEEGPQVMAMPRDMATFQTPALPEPETLAAHGGALQALQRALGALHCRVQGGECAAIDLAPLSDADRALLNQVLGEGEVAVHVRPDADGRGVQAQESVFAGLWRVLHLRHGAVVADTLEVGAVPQAVHEAVAHDGSAPPRATPWPEGAMNAPSLYEELVDRARRWRPGDAAHVVNLTLLPLSEVDSHGLQARLDEGRVSILSRGYGNCRIVGTRLLRTWRVTYFNAQDMIILDTLEVGGVPEVACAAVQDLEDSAERLTEVLQWVAQH
jgi:hydrogenase-1 operon protein HyaF